MASRAMTGAETPEDRDRQRQFFVYEEFCVVITLDPEAPMTDLYGSVLTWLTDHVNDIRPFRQIPGIDPKAPFQPIETRGRTPDFVLTPKDGPPRTAILFYRIGVSENPNDKSPDARASLVLSVVQALNDPDIARNERAKWRIRGVTPNWLAAASGSEDSGSPAAPPEPTRNPGHPPKKWTYAFAPPARAKQVQQDLQDIVDGARGATDPSPVTVAIIDTCPTQGELDTAQGAFGTNELLLEVCGDKDSPGGRVRIVPDVADISTAVGGVVPDWEGWLKPWLDATAAGTTAPLRRNRYGMPSHGMFAAGIVKDIAPNVVTHLIGALDGAGISTLDALTSAFVMLPGLRGEWGLVANCSWTTSTVSRNPDHPRQRALADLADESFQLVLQVLIEWLAEYDILVVAAVGNNALDTNGQRPPARYPAAFANDHDNVFSVAATAKKVGQAAEYTNKGAGVGGPVAGNRGGGAAVIGGDAELYKGKTRIKRDKQHRPDAIRGVFWQPQFPFTMAPNKTGLALWAGTSFATPVITALAAILWSAGDRPQDVIASVLAYAQTPVNGLNVSAIYARQKTT